MTVGARVTRHATLATSTRVKRFPAKMAVLRNGVVRVYERRPLPPCIMSLNVAVIATGRDWILGKRITRRFSSLSISLRGDHCPPNCT